MLHAQEDGEQEPAGQETRLLLCQDQGGNEEAIHASIVLEVYVINDEEAW